MAHDSQDSKLSIAANIIGLLTFALSALNLVIVRVLQNERRVIEQLRKRGWKDSVRALEQKALYNHLFDPDFAGFRGNSIYPAHPPENTHGPGEKPTSQDSLSDKKLQNVIGDVQKRYDNGKILIYETEGILQILAEEIDIYGYARAIIRLILRWDVKGFYEASGKVWRGLRNWREAFETMGRLEDNYRECKCTPVTNCPSFNGKRRRWHGQIHNTDA